MIGHLLVTASLVLALSGQEPEVPTQFFEGLNILPRGIPFTQEQVIRILIPAYETKIAKSKKALSDVSDPRARWNSSYEAAVVGCRRTNLGMPGEDFLLVVISEQETPCHGCRYSTFGGIDLRRGRSIGSFKPGEAGFADMSSIRLIKKGTPWKVVFNDSFGPPVRKCSVVTEWPADVQKTSAGIQLDFAHSLRHVEGNCDE
jgi:hypothetical protein